VAQHLTGIPILGFMFILLHKRRRYSDYATGWTVRGSNPDRGKRKFFPFSKTPRRAPGPRSLPFSGPRPSFQEVKRSGLHVDRSPPSRTVVKNEWRYTATPPICVQGLDKENFVFLRISMFHLGQSNALHHKGHHIHLLHVLLPQHWD